MASPSSALPGWFKTKQNASSLREPSWLEYVPHGIPVKRPDNRAIEIAQPYSLAESNSDITGQPPLVDDAATTGATKVTLTEPSF